MLDITIKVNDTKYTYPKGISLLEISKDFVNNFKDKIIISKVNGSLCELNQKIFNNSTVKFFDRYSLEGNKVYESGLLFILIKAFKDELDTRLKIEHSLDKGILVTTDKMINEELLKRVKKRIDNIISEDIQIDKLLINRKEAIAYYQKEKELDKVNMLRYNTNTNINLYKLDNTYDYFFSNLPISTGYIKEYKLNLINTSSFVISYPNLYYDKINYRHHEKLFSEFKRFSDWSNKIGIEYISDLNNKVSNGDIND